MNEVIEDLEIQKRYQVWKNKFLENRSESLKMDGLSLLKEMENCNFSSGEVIMELKDMLKEDQKELSNKQKEDEEELPEEVQNEKVTVFDCCKFLFNAIAIPLALVFFTEWMGYQSRKDRY